MDINSNLILSKVEIVQRGSTVDEVSESLTIPNPEYAIATRFAKHKRFFSSSVAKYLSYLRFLDGKYVLPRYFFGEPYKKLPTTIGRETSYKSFIGLRDYQKEFVSEYAKELKSCTGLLFEAPCGHGKTILGIWWAHRIGYQTMVIVPTYYLGKQWKQRILEITNASVFLMTSKDIVIPTDSDFTIVVMDLFTVRKLPQELIDNTGHVIIDEAHRIGADVYMPILDELPAVYRTALTATFRRADGMHRILQYHFGTLLKMSNRFPPPDVYTIDTGVSLTGVFPKSKKYDTLLKYLEDSDIDFAETKKTIIFNPKVFANVLKKDLEEGRLSKNKHTVLERALKKSKELHYATVESYLNDSGKRRKVIIKLIKECLADGRNILVLSKRKDIMYSLANFFKDVNPMVIVSETSERTSEEEDYLQNHCRLIFGVNQLAKEGLDIERLDTLILLFPMVDTEQAIGRISRLFSGKRRPICFYLLDNCPVVFATFTKARSFIKINATYCGNTKLSNLKNIFDN